MTDHDVAKLVEEFRMPRHIRMHCGAVAHFSAELAGKLISRGEKIDLEKLRHAAILHDLVRVVDIRKFEPENFVPKPSPEDIEFWNMLRQKYRGKHHAEAAAEILRERGFPDIAEIVLKHRFLQIRDGFNSWEEKLVYYADKRVQHDQVVSLRQRLDDGRKRNAPETEGSEDAKLLDKKVFDLEREIFVKIGEKI